MKPTESKPNWIEARINRGLWKPGEESLEQKRSQPRSAWSCAFQSAKQAIVKDRNSQEIDGQLTADDLTTAGLKANTLVQGKRVKALAMEMYKSGVTWNPFKKTARPQDEIDALRAQMMRNVDEQWSVMTGVTVNETLDPLNRGRFETRMGELHNAGELGYVRDENGVVIAKPIWGKVYKRREIDETNS